MYSNKILSLGYERSGIRWAGSGVSCNVTNATIENTQCPARSRSLPNAALDRVVPPPRKGTGWNPAVRRRPRIRSSPAAVPLNNAERRHKARGQQASANDPGSCVHRRVDRVTAATRSQAAARAAFPYDFASKRLDESVGPVFV